MVPATRATKVVHRKDQTKTATGTSNPSDSWELVPHNNDQDDAMDPMTPLRDMADRVGREVDHFAETLDQFNQDLHDKNHAFDAAYELTVEYKAFANTLVQRLKKRHDAQRLHEMRNEFGKRLPESSTSAWATGSAFMRTSQRGDDGDLDQTSLDTLKQWQAENNTWELFRIMLELRRNPNHGQLQKDKEEKLAQLGNTTRYTSDAALWEKFTLEDNVAKERYLVLKWLQGTADQGEQDIEAISDLSDQKSGKGNGMWVNGWMETREKIKGAKRTRLVSAPNASQLDIKRSDTNELLVSALDPDAPTRQHRVLEKQDAVSERSLWMTCWEMLRRGRSWAEVCEWCSARNQSWRAVSLGASTDSTQDVPMPGYSYGKLWRRLCYALATSKAIDEYEAAVYGLLSGDLETVNRVSKSWDDRLYATYNSLLLQSFDAFVQRSQPHRSHLKGFSIPDSGFAAANIPNETVAADLVKRLQDDASTAAEARQPLKLIQASLIAGTFEELCYNLSHAITAAPWYQLSQTDTTADVMLETAITKDIDALRIVTHMLILLRKVDPSLNYSTANMDVLDNIISAYIQFLSVAGKRDLAPLYASKMSPSRAKKALAQVLCDVYDVQDKVSFIRLMDLYKVSPVAALVEQTHQLVQKLTTQRDAKEAQLHIIEDTKDSVYPGHRIKLDFTSAGIGSEGLADHLIVFYLVEGHWDITFATLAYACRKLLLGGHFLEVSHLVRRLPFESLSAAKTRHILGKGINVMDREETIPFAGNIEHAATLRLLQKQSQAYYELTLLVRAIGALESWRQTEHAHMSKIPPPTSAPAKLKKAFADTCAALEPVFTGILLSAKDDTEAEELSRIRALYLPELVLAYSATLCAAAHLVSRDNFMRCMELATVVADSKNGLADAIMQAGRMQEVVTAFARTSETMLKLNEIGKPRREKRHKNGGNLAIWEIGG